jgi:chemotaxis receptor (MCP) glutamine deamidase CheD
MNLELNLNSPQKIRAIITQEVVKEGQRIRRYHIEAKINGTWTKIMPEDETLTIGQKKIDKFPTAIQTDGIKIVVEDCFAEPIFRSLRAYYF